MARGAMLLVTHLLCCRTMEASVSEVGVRARCAWEYERQEHFKQCEAFLNDRIELTIGRCFFVLDKWHLDKLLS
eukprot:108035-Amphidinium_carterae.2